MPDGEAAGPRRPLGDDRTAVARGTTQAEGGSAPGPGLRRLALIVRGADTPAKDLTPQSQGLEAIAEGFRLLYDDDHAQLAAETVVYDALYRYCQAQEECP